jgi:hypothetical protein
MIGITSRQIKSRKSWKPSAATCCGHLVSSEITTDSSAKLDDGISSAGRAGMERNWAKKNEKLIEFLTGPFQVTVGGSSVRLQVDSVLLSS